MKKLTTLIAAMTISAPLIAEEPTLAELLAEIQTLRDRVTDLESQVEEAKAAPVLATYSGGAAAPAGGGAAAPKSSSAPSLSVGNVTSKFGIDLYGFVKLDAIASSQDVVTDTIPFWVRQTNGSNDDGQFNFTAKESRIGARLRGPEYAGGKLSGLAEFDFYGDFADTSTRHAYEMRTRQLYLQYATDDWSILAGKTWETFAASLPKTLNFSYYNLMGQLGLRRTQVRYTRNFKIDEDSKFVAKLALAEPLGGLHGGDLDGDGVDDGHESDIPMFQYNLAYSTPVLTEKPSTFSFSGFVGEETADVDRDGDDENFESYAVIGGLTFPITDKLTLKGSIWSGTNVDSAWGGINQGINTTLNDTIDAYGGWAQLGYQATDKLKMHVGYSTDNPDDDDLNTGGRTRNTSFVINGFYTFTPGFEIGLEYMNLETQYKDGPDADTSWIQTSLIYKF